MSKTNQPNNYATCGAKTRAGTPCKRPAGWGTNHVGEGKCKLHGGKSTGAPKKNKNSEKHGLYAKYFPKETLEVFMALEDEDPLDILYASMKLKWTQIILAPGKMIDGDYGRHMDADSRAMAVLNGMIKNYYSLLDRGLGTEEQRLRIKKLEVEIKQMTENKDEEASREGIESFIKAIAPTDEDMSDLYDDED